MHKSHCRKMKITTYLHSRRSDLSACYIICNVCVFLLWRANFERGQKAAEVREGRAASTKPLLLPSVTSAGVSKLIRSTAVVLLFCRFGRASVRHGGVILSAHHRRAAGHFAALRHHWAALFPPDTLLSHPRQTVQEARPHSRLNLSHR